MLLGKTSKQQQSLHENKNDGCCCCWDIFLDQRSSLGIIWVCCGVRNIFSCADDQWVKRHRARLRTYLDGWSLSEQHFSCLFIDISFVFLKIHVCLLLSWRHGSALDPVSYVWQWRHSFVKCGQFWVGCHIDIQIHCLWPCQEVDEVNVRPRQLKHQQLSSLVFAFEVIWHKGHLQKAWVYMCTANITDHTPW